MFSLNTSLHATPANQLYPYKRMRGKLAHIPCVGKPFVFYKLMESFFKDSVAPSPNIPSHTALTADSFLDT